MKTAKSTEDFDYSDVPPTPPPKPPKNKTSLA